MPTASTPGAPLLARTFSHAPTRRRLSISNDFSFFGFGLPFGSSPSGLTSGRPDLSDPFTPAPLQSLHRYYESVRPCAPHRYSAPRGVPPLASSLSTTRGPTPPISTGRHYRGDRFSCSMPAPATSSCHLYTGHHQGSMQAAPWLKAHQIRPANVPRPPTDPGFDATVVSHDASAVVHTRSSSRRLPDTLIACLLRSRFPPRLLTGMTLRWFGISACTANPEDLPPSLAQHGSC